MRLLITTPAEIVVDQRNVTSLRAEDASGSFGILEGHADLLTALAVCVISWKDEDGAAHFCVVRHGVLTVHEGNAIAIATRQAFVGDDLEQLEGSVLSGFRQAAEAERASRTQSLEIQLRAVREIIRYLRPERRGLLGDSL